MNLFKIFIEASQESCRLLRKEINGPFYSNPGYLYFFFKGERYLIKEPNDVMPVNGGEAGKAWVLKQILNRNESIKEFPETAGTVKG